MVTQLKSIPLESRVRELGDDLWQRMQGEIPGAFNKDYWIGRVLEWAMEDDSFKVDLFRLVDVLPTLQTTDQLREHIQEYLLKPGRELPKGLHAALKLSSSGWTGGLAAKGIRKGVTEMAQRFIVGEDAEPALPALRNFHKLGFAFTVDLLGEATLSDQESMIYQHRYTSLIDTLADEVDRWALDNCIAEDHRGAIPVANVSVKISALHPYIDPVDPQGSVTRVAERLLPLLVRARERNVFINLDMEQWEYHSITMDLFESMLLHPKLIDWPHLGIAIQAYALGAEDDLHRLVELSKRRATPLTVRLVKGAYWDYEVVHARQHGYKIPLFMDKAETDLNFEKLSTYLLKNYNYITPALASHNLRSLAYALALAESLDVPKAAFEIQMLHGMAEPERKALRDSGHRVRIYTPVGELIPGMAYLVRRLLENTSNEGFLNLSHQKGIDIANLLGEPTPKIKTIDPPINLGVNGPFKNAAFTNFAEPSARDSFANAVEKMPHAFPIAIPVVIGDEKRNGESTHTHRCPSDTSHVVSEVSMATVEDAEQAVQYAWNAYPAWRDRPIEERATLLDRLADRIEHDRNDLAALMVYEAGKPWREADGDVLEAIDFCRYYARQALKELTPQTLGEIPGEVNALFYEGRGPTAVIAPWNFPLAILCGMTTAALVSGNPVIMKPSEQSSAIAYALYTRLRDVGFPSDVIQFLPGVGECVGAHLVEHPLIAQIAFTGSKQVGLSILRKAMNTRPEQPQIKRVICEMGGKNAIIVDDDADIDEAVVGIIHSAFGFAGQKCSACSRLFIVKSVYESVLKRLIEATRSINIAPAHDPACQLGPVIDPAAQERLLAVINQLNNGATLRYRGEVPSGGCYVPPTIVEVTKVQHPLMQDELFGPILAVMCVDDYEAGINAALYTEFALTGAVYSRNPSHLDLAQKRFRVGNLYLNQSSTGAMVGRQAFGGFAMSGIGTKAGGPRYLLNFADPRCVTENTMRCGFSPEVML